MSCSWYETIQSELFSANDRSIIIVGCAMIESTLRDLIKSHLVRPDENNDSLFGGNKPLATFSSNIDLAFRMGIFDFHVRDSLRTLKKIRNRCAHESSEISLNKTPYKDQLDSIRKKLDVWRKNRSMSHRDLAVHICMKLIGTFDGVRHDIEINSENNNASYGAYIYVKNGNLNSAMYSKQKHPTAYSHSESDPRE